jgi:hypothetical protein
MVMAAVPEEFVVTASVASPLDTVLAESPSITIVPLAAVALTLTNVLASGLPFVSSSVKVSVVGVAPMAGDVEDATSEPFEVSILAGQIPEMKLASGLPSPDAMS